MIVSHHVLPALAAAGILAAGFSVMDRRAPVDYLAGYVEPYEARPGQVVTFHWRADWKRACQGAITRTFTDARGVLRPDGTLTVQAPPELRVHDYSTETVIPATLVSGPGYYQSFGRYWCTPLQYWWPIEVQTPRIPFTIVR